MKAIYTLIDFKIGVNKGQIVKKIDWIKSLDRNAINRIFVAQLEQPMFEKLKQRSFQKVIEKRIKNRDFSQVNAPLQTLGFLVNEDVFKTLEQLQNSNEFFEIQSKDLKVFSFVTMSKKAPSLRQNQVSNKDFSWSGSLTNQNATEFLAIPFDVLVGYYGGENQYLDLMMAQSKAKFKVGISNADPIIFDLLIDTKMKEYETFKNELKKYLQVLGKL